MDFRTLYDRAYDIFLEGIFRNSVYMILSTVITAFSGFLFWIVATRYYTTEAIGIGSALISVVGLISILSKLGLETSLIRYYNESEKKVELINSFLTIPAIVSLILSVVFLVTVDMWAASIGAVNDEWMYSSAFVVVAVSESVRPIQREGVFLALRRAKYSLIQSTTSVVRILVVPVLVGLGGVGIYLSFGFTVVAGVTVGFFLTNRLVESYRLKPTLNRSIYRRVWTYSVSNYLARTAEDLLGLALPLIVLLVLGPVQNAYFYIAWQILMLLLSVPRWTAQALLAEGSHAPSNFQSDFRKAHIFTFMFLVVGVAVTVFGGELLLSLFGDGYSENGYRVLVLLSLGSLPFGINALYASKMRILKDNRQIIYIYFAVAIMTLIGSYVGMQRMGLPAVGFAWLLSNGIVAASIYLDKLGDYLLSTPN